MQTLYTVKEAAEFLRVNEATIYRAIKAGTINSRRAGKKAYRFTEADLMEFLAGGPQKLPDSAPANREAPIKRII